MKRVYLDHNATSPLRPEARSAMLAILDEPGNASSIHKEGRTARQHLDRAREDIARFVGANPAQVFFTSGATEANNWVLQNREQRVLVSAIEHASVLGAKPDAEQIPVDTNGIIDLNVLEEMLSVSAAPALVSIMAVNNETGVIQPLKKASAIIHRHGGALHCDAVQAAGRIRIDIDDFGADYLTLSAHKLGGPQGVGALIVAEGIDPPPLIKGGMQENRRRAGTENIAGIAGFAAAATASIADVEDYERISSQRELLETALTKITPNVIIFAKDAPRAGNTTLFCLPGLSAETQLMALDLAGIAVSSGSACSSGKVTTSHVLDAMGFDQQTANGAVRVSLGWNTKPDDIAYFVLSWQELYRRHASRLTTTIQE